MPKEDLIKLKGKVTQALPNSTFKVEIENGHEIIAYTAGKIKQNRITIIEGDEVSIEMTPYDLGKGRITFRL